MVHASAESLKVAEKFVKGQAAQSPLVPIGMPLNIPGEGWYRGEKGRRVTTDGTTLYSYGWWPIATHTSRGIWITTDRYQTGEWNSGNPKYSPTTDGHIAAVEYESRIAGYRATDETMVIKDLGGDTWSDRTYRLYTK